MHEDLAHRDHNGEFGNAIVDGQAPKEFRILHQPGLSAHAQRVVEPRNDEQQSDARVGENIDQGVEAVIARSVRYRQRVLIKNFDEADRVAARTDIGASVPVLRPDAEERRTPDEGLRILVE